MRLRDPADCRPFAGKVRCFGESVGSTSSCGPCAGIGWTAGLDPFRTPTNGCRNAYGVPHEHPSSHPPPRTEAKPRVTDWCRRSAETQEPVGPDRPKTGESVPSSPQSAAPSTARICGRPTETESVARPSPSRQTWRVGLPRWRKSRSNRGELMCESGPEPGTEG